MSFRSPLRVEEHLKGNWVLTTSLVYEGNKDRFVIPAGFQTDFASVPKVFWSLFPPYGRFTKAAVLHDYLYAVAPDVGRGSGPSFRTVQITRAEADGLFLRVMRQLDTPLWRRKLMYLAVHWFGASTWRKARGE